MYDIVRYKIVQVWLLNLTLIQVATGPNETLYGTISQVSVTCYHLHQMEPSDFIWLVSQTICGSHVCDLIFSNFLK